jgi:hypothetical protein
MPVKRSASR